MFTTSPSSLLEAIVRGDGVEIKRGGVFHCYYYLGFRGKGQSLLVVDVAVDVTIDGLLRGPTILIGETIEHGHQGSNDEVLGHILGLQMIDDILYGVLIVHTISI